MVWVWTSFFSFFFFFFWTTFKVFIESVTILFLLYVLVLWTQGMWDFSSLTSNRTHSPCIGRRSLKTTGLVRGVPFLNFLRLEFIWISRDYNNYHMGLWGGVNDMMDTKPSAQWLVHCVQYIPVSFLSRPLFSSMRQRRSDVGSIRSIWKCKGMLFLHFCERLCKRFTVDERD